MSAEERRESVIRAAITEFARGGYSGTSTEVIARRVGVSQPYLFRLFPSKRAIFLAAAARCLEDTGRLFREAAENAPPGGVPAAMGAAYQDMIERDREKLLMQMQMYVAVASAEASGDHEFGHPIREGWQQLRDTIHLALGADEDETAGFLAEGMLMNTLVCLGYPAGHPMWAGHCKD
ncbi:AcrR family transcriptional regulator [Streptomyces olivoverticillatus]|uniref:AcrR family transcriptional regulator n=1 Tax=Streptomyces olivoverticillatus TaxID=66427 RepID=A0A7W7LQD9_9ACTN|nr:TetR/AcrR family transcriptional regulator [Streptomyces olivoverticillatus]MBB4894518.1 AcrR family transcriptional regulator [Streptomyces olivoverticillatus]